MKYTEQNIIGVRFAIGSNKYTILSIEEESVYVRRETSGAKMRWCSLPQALHNLNEDTYIKVTEAKNDVYEIY